MFQDGHHSLDGRLCQWGLISDPECVLCNAAGENHLHLFFNCPMVFQVWNHFQGKVGIQCMLWCTTYGGKGILAYFNIWPMILPW